MAKQQDLSVGEVAARSGLAVSAIHFYEAKGLIASWRNSSNHRRYPRSVLRKLAVIKVAQRAGVPLKEIAEAMATIPDNHSVSAKDWSRLSREWKARLDARIYRLTRLRDMLGYCIGCGCLSVNECQLFNPEDQLAEQGSGPQLLDPDA